MKPKNESPLQKAKRAMSGQTTAERVQAAEEASTGRGQPVKETPKRRRPSAGSVSADFWGE